MDQDERGWADADEVIASSARRTVEGLTVAVVGATGNLGTSVVRTLSEDPRVGKVIGLARRVPAWFPPKTTWVSVDIVHEDRLAELFRTMDTVVHLAWQFQPAHRPVLTWRTNVLGSIRVFQAAADAAVPGVVYASSVGAYSPGPKYRTVDESWPTHGWPDAAYCREKAYLERYLDAYERQYPWIRVARMRPAFLFKRESASEQRRLVAGPLFPGRLVRPDHLPVVPDLPGMRIQALHTDDAAEAFCEAVTSTVQGAFNLAADPVVDAAMLAELFRARRVRVPVGPVRAGMTAAWRTRLLPLPPQLFDAALRLPLMDSGRAREEMGWAPRHTSAEAIEAFVEGLRARAGMDTPPLAPRPASAGRARELVARVTDNP